jgi:hypothetical protein
VGPLFAIAPGDSSAPDARRSQLQRGLRQPSFLKTHFDIDVLFDMLLPGGVTPCVTISSSSSLE